MCVTSQCPVVGGGGGTALHCTVPAANVRWGSHTQALPIPLAQSDWNLNRRWDRNKLGRRWQGSVRWLRPACISLCGATPLRPRCTSRCRKVGAI